MNSFERKPRSSREQALLADAKRLLPTGTRSTTLDEARMFVVASAQGSRLRDASGNEYIDYLLGSGPHVLGHAHPAVTEAVRAQLERGSSYLMTSEPTLELAREIVDLVPCAEMVSFHNSGSEATFFALRTARAYRGRDTVLKFEGGFHGMHDYALMSNQWTYAPSTLPEPSPNSYGIPKAVQGTVLVAPYNDLTFCEALIRERHEELGAVIIEPLQRTFPPVPGFLQGLRRITTEYGIPLVFDEVVTGFRVALGGAQELYGVTPDLCALGKTISAGLPLGVLCGRRELMEIANPLRRMAQKPFSMQTGTYCGNAISAVAALAVIRELKRPGVYERVARTGRALISGFSEALAQAGIPGQVLGEPSVFQVWFGEGPFYDHRSSLKADMFRSMRFADLLLDRGVLKAHEKFFVSAAHDDEDVARTLEAFAGALKELAGR
jgi:glutamate-1-semialdehyde 2,1-aminomutase